MCVDVFTKLIEHYTIITRYTLVGVVLTGRKNFRICMSDSDNLSRDKRSTKEVRKKVKELFPPGTLSKI